MELSAILANRRWLRREHPFPHFYARDVFFPEVYREMEAAFQALLVHGLTEGGPPLRFARTIAGYDVLALGFRRGLPGPLRVFTSRAWHDLMATLCGVPATGDVNGALHHHETGSLSGRPHNDLNPGWFPAVDPPDGEVNLSDPALCSYHTGAGPAGHRVRETIRAAALLFYLNNGPWSPGDGGETGLYDSDLRRTDDPCVAVPPLNNSLLLFECTARSYHAFIKNRRAPRSSVVMWIHRPKEDAVRRWGQGSIIGWDGPAVLNEGTS